MHDDGEVDARGTYTVVAVASLLNMLTPELADGVAEFTVRRGIERSAPPPPPPRNRKQISEKYNCSEHVIRTKYVLIHDEDVYRYC